MFWKTVAGNQFMQGTLPHIIRTVEQLSLNIGRSAMALEKRNATLGIGGSTDYLAQLLDRYGPDATMASVAVRERQRLAADQHEKVDEQFKSLDSVLDGSGWSEEEGN